MLGVVEGLVTLAIIKAYLHCHMKYVYIYVKLKNALCQTASIGVFRICDCLSENPPSSHLPVFREIPF